MTSRDVLEAIAGYQNDQIKKIYLNHGATEPLYGVKIEDLKKIQKKIKKNHSLALELYNTGISDAMYLAGLIADEKTISRKELQQWAEKAPWHMISEFTVPWVAAESPFGWELGLEWINSEKESIASSGWSTLAAVLCLRDDSQLDLTIIKGLLARIEQTIHQEKNRVRYTMNNFVIACGSYVEALFETAMETAEKIGAIEVDMGGTACKTPLAPQYIQKVKEKGKTGKKKKTVRC